MDSGIKKQLEVWKVYSYQIKNEMQKILNNAVNNAKNNAVNNIVNNVNNVEDSIINKKEKSKKQLKVRVSKADKI